MLTALRKILKSLLTSLFLLMAISACGHNLPRSLDTSAWRVNKRVLLISQHVTCGGISNVGIGMSPLFVGDYFDDNFVGKPQYTAYGFIPELPVFYPEDFHYRDDNFVGKLVDFQYNDFVDKVQEYLSTSRDIKGVRYPHAATGALTEPIHEQYIDVARKEGYTGIVVLYITLSGKWGIYDAPDKYYGKQYRGRIMSIYFTPLVRVRVFDNYGENCIGNFIIRTPQDGESVFKYHLDVPKEIETSERKGNIKTLDNTLKVIQQQDQWLMHNLIKIGL